MDLILQWLSWHYLHSAAVKGAGFSLVSQMLAGELIDAFSLLHELRPVKPFGHNQAGPGVCGNFCIQSAFPPGIVYPYGEILDDMARCSIVGMDQQCWPAYKFSDFRDFIKG